MVRVGLKHRGLPKAQLLTGLQRTDQSDERGFVKDSLKEAASQIEAELRDV